MLRRKTRQVHLGALPVGGGAPISVQSMCSTDTRNVRATVRQARRLRAAGCEVIRIAVPDDEAARALPRIRRALPGVPLVADIHFDHKLALAAVDAGFDGLRLNPGNIGGPARVREVVAAARERKVPIRVGVNAGSVEKDLAARHGGPTPRAMAQSALRHVRIIEDAGYREIKVSVKSFDVPSTIDAYSLLAAELDYPFHAGITEAGTAFSGGLRSGVGLGILLYLGLADTIRVSLTADPVMEVTAGFRILKAMGLRRRGADVVSCPTCGRCHGDVLGIASRIEKRLTGVTEDIRVAVMGCEVNGPGEAREADVGLAIGRSGGLLFREGKAARKVPESEMEPALVEEVRKVLSAKA
ncbi:MAG: flavodoxin-dependent (E)-4-hydroxy-3-methylbut-2-enyl-diphosphate synthase [Deltaproteobacteria bacterium]|nr:flavodoxin-dependent (E)-4-hydroxy-3-methylbut-2-enyl-diphosphate synthase [Deltaproteobacteria bacterium]